MDFANAFKSKRALKSALKDYPTTEIEKFTRLLQGALDERLEEDRMIAEKEQIKQQNLAILTQRILEEAGASSLDVEDVVAALSQQRKRSTKAKSTTKQTSVDAE